MFSFVSTVVTGWSVNCKNRGIGYIKDGNCFPWIEDISLAQKLLNGQLKRDWKQMLNRLAFDSCPASVQIEEKFKKVVAPACNRIKKNGKTYCGLNPCVNQPTSLELNQTYKNRCIQNTHKEREDEGLYYGRGKGKNPEKTIFSPKPNLHPPTNSFSDQFLPFLAGGVICDSRYAVSHFTGQ